MRTSLSLDNKAEKGVVKEYNRSWKEEELALKEIHGSWKSHVAYYHLCGLITGS